MKRAKMSLTKIANIAGVSKSTVSRVVNNDPNVNDQTRAKVQKVIDEYNFIPNRAARTLVTNRTQAIGVVVTNGISAFFDTSLYFPTILRGIAQAANEREYAMLLMMGQNEEDDLRFARRIVQGHMMDGIILVSPPIDHPIIDELIETKTKFISADRIDRPDIQVNFVTVENVESSRRAVEHLINLGRKRIVILAGFTNVIDSRDRIQGYRLALEDAGIPYDPALVKIVAYEQEGGYAGIQELLRSGIEFDAVYANQSDIALGATNGLLDAGIRLPQDVSLIGFDDLAESNNPRIGISTVHHPVFDKGQQLVYSLIDLIEEKVAPPIQHFMPTHLVIRDTCGGLRNGSV